MTQTTDAGLRLMVAFQCDRLLFPAALAVALYLAARIVAP